MKLWSPFRGARWSILAVALSLGVVAVVFWSGLGRVEALFRENEALQRSLARLQEEEVVAYCWLLQAPVADRLQLAWLDVPADGSEPVDFRTLELQGREFYGEGLIVKFPGALVADGEARAMLLWRRAFGSDQAPVEGPVLEEPGRAPKRYRQWLRGELKPASEERFWEALWDLAHDPERLSALGIEAVYGNAVSIQPRPGYFYTIKLSAAGTLSLRAQPMSEAPAGWGT